MAKCMLCPRRCGVDRRNGEVGFCGAGDKIKIGRYSLHMWEEPCISGTNGSGTVFFSHCNMKCVYCQNRKISTGGAGREITVGRLCEIFLELQSRGAHNINLVTPTHFADKIRKALICAKKAGLTLPIVYNCGGYESVGTLRMLDGLIDIYMPDFKYCRAEYARKYSAAPDYPEIAAAAIDEMARQVLPAVYENGLMRRGLIVRHLLLPGLLYDAKKIVDLLYGKFGDDVCLSLMSQYTPTPGVRDIPAINRTVGAREYDALCDYCAKIGITNAYTQDGAAASESFIPDFYD